MARSLTTSAATFSLAAGIVFGVGGIADFRHGHTGKGFFEEGLAVMSFASFGLGMANRRYED